jgi:hypothetical protein
MIIHSLAGAARHDIPCTQTESLKKRLCQDGVWRLKGECTEVPQMGMSWMEKPESIELEKVPSGKRTKSY